jgi:hypothetical protein
MSKMKTKLKISRRSVQYALLNQANRTLFGGILGLGVVTAMLFHFDMNFFAGLLTLLLLGSFGMLIWTSLVEYSAAEAHNKFALLSNWAQTAATPEERAQRWSLLQLNNLDDAWEQSSLDYSGPRYNVDGTAMLPGNSMLDYNGNMYGSSDIAMATYNPGTTSWADPASAYSNPLSSDMGGGTGFMDTSSMSGGLSDFGSDSNSIRHD